MHSKKNYPNYQIYFTKLHYEFRTMIKAYFVVRRLAYFFGISGVVGLLLGRSGRVSWHEQAQDWGAGGVLVCFLLLFVTYGLYVVIKLRRK